MFTEVVSRFRAWWHFEALERPVVTLRAHGVTTRPPEEPRFVARHSAWLDAEYQLDRFEASLEERRLMGDAVPVFWPNVGPDLLATLFGCELEFGDDTSWSLPFAEHPRDVIGLEPSFDGVYWQTIERMSRLSISRAQGRWWTAFADLHPNADLVAALIGPENLAFACSDDPDDVRSAVEHVTPTCIEAYDRLDRLIRCAGLPMLTWLEAPYSGRMYVACCDFSALVSPASFEELVLPSLLVEAGAMDRVIFHLDGPSALRHLDAVLRVPEFHALQWVYGACSGPARRWGHVYRAAQEAGKSIQVICEDVDDALWARRELAPEGLWIDLERSQHPDPASRLLDTLWS